MNTSTMKIQLLITFAFFPLFSLYAQVANYPSPAHKGTLLIKNGTVHIGRDNQIQEQSDILVRDGKIITISSTNTNTSIPPDAQVIDATGQHVYPGLILASTQIGLREIAAVRSTLDEAETGDFNPSVRSIISYNTDSRFINNLRDNGILLANIAPKGGVIAGRSSLVQLDAWNWEDALYKDDVAVHLYMPSLIDIPILAQDEKATEKHKKQFEQNLNKVKEAFQFLKEAKAYCLSSNNPTLNLKFEALRKLFSKQQKLFIHCDWIKEMLLAVELANELGVFVVIVGGYDSWKITDILKKENIAVILEGTHQLPAMEDDDIKQPFLTPSILYNEGVLFAITSENSHDRGRNLAYHAGTAAAYGLPKEIALQALTYNAAKILGVEHETGTLEVGKDANIIITEGDVLNIKESKVYAAFIKGRKINLDNAQKELNRRYEYKYGIK